MTFADLGLSDELLRAVTEAGYDTPTPIQVQAIPSVLMMRDLIGIAQTGTGKTAAFVLPMIDILGEGRSRARMPRSLILEPTRELAMQVAENFDKYGKYHKLNMALLIGGTNMADQIKKLEKGVDVLIATPGRLMDLFGRGKIMLNGCSLLVIDEADRMLDMGFIPDIEEICTKLPKQRQTLLFSATMPPVIKKLADKFLTNPKQIEVARPAQTNMLIDQRILRVDARKKRDALADQIKKLEKGVDVLIATPGRLMDLFGRGKIMLNGCSLLVIDEADRMLDMGFIPDIEEICTKLPKQRQTLLFSATMPPVIKKLADKFLTNPKQIEVARPAQTNMLIDQRIFRVDARKKRDALADILRNGGVRSAIVFCNRKTTVRELATSLKRGHLKVGQIHGDMEQSERISELARFKADEINVLVASDVAARGLDIKDVSHIFNYDVPWHPDDYVHRIGRTGRAGKTGIAITFVTTADAESIDNIQKLTSTVIPELGAAPVVAEAACEEREPRKEREPREERQPREARAPREPRPARETREPRKTREPREPRREREPRAEEPRASRERPARRDREPEPEGADEGWNGPVPSFLGTGFGG